MRFLSQLPQSVVRAFIATALVTALAVGCGDSEPGSVFDPTSGDGGDGSMAAPDGDGPDTSFEPDPTFLDASLKRDATPSGPVDPTNPNNATKDSDCDGLSDAEEFGNVYPGGKKTSPTNPDSDGDGIKDGVELGRMTSVSAACAFTGDADPSSKTIPTEIDSDADGIADGIEDTNKDGKADPTETDPHSPDTDGDGLFDGLEDVNKNGILEAGETDPRKKDTDGDGINDGVEINVTKTNPTKADTDGDTCSDGFEDLNRNGVVDTGETNPLVASDCGPANLIDTDGDGLPDKVEDYNLNGVVDLGETDKTKPDTDGDGISDGVEDKNKNRIVDTGETSPLRKDSDCDGLIDGPNAGTTLGEDQNANGVVDPGETNPVLFDTDSDGIRDGIERGVTVNPDPTLCLGFIPDGDTAATANTDPTKKDSDGDGIDDGAEDSNQNGKVDPGELNPNDPTDGVGPVADVCPAPKMKVIQFQQDLGPDVQIALPATFNEVTKMTLGGSVRGYMGYDSSTKVTFIVYRAPAPGAATTPTADEALLKPKIATAGVLANAITQTFTTWDGYPALLGFYDQVSSVDLKTHANALANTLLNDPTAGVLTATAGVTGPFKVQAEYVHRSATSVITLVAITPGAAAVSAPEPAIFTVTDTAGGSALAQFGDQNAPQCERFNAGAGKVDFLFVVDNSGSMAASQASLVATANTMQASLGNSSLDYRIGLVTTDYSNTGGAVNGLRGFTTDIPTFKGWLTSTNANWIGTSGSGTEKMVKYAARAVSQVTPPVAIPALPTLPIPGKMRLGAKLVIILVGDADDQSSLTGDSVVQLNTRYSNVFLTNGATVSPTDGPTTNTPFTNGTGGAIKVHGIICPVGANCNGETQQSPQRNGAVITATGGLRGDLTSAASISATVDAIVKDAIASAGYKLLKPPIGASIKVALSAVLTPASCTASDIPRSRVNGFDFDSINRSIAFFGACRPPAAATSTPGAVSYRYWVDTTSNPNGTPPPCFNDPNFDPTQVDWCKGALLCNLNTNTCECPANCGGAPPPGKTCDTNPNVCAYICTSDCGGSCTPFQACDQASCSCKCVQSATCPAGFTFDTTACGCVCNTAALNCAGNYMADANACACVCKPGCGGCTGGNICNQATCACEQAGPH